MHTKPLLVIPRSSRVATMLDADMLAIEPRAQRVGVALIAPRSIAPAELMSACSIWPNVLAHAGVSRLAVVLGLDAYVRAAPLLVGCRQVMQERNVDVAYFHEGHLESDQIRAFFERRRPHRRLTSDAMIKLSQRYALRGDIRSAAHARRLAEVAAGASYAERTGSHQMGGYESAHQHASATHDRTLDVPTPGKRTLTQV